MAAVAFSIAKKGNVISPPQIQIGNYYVKLNLTFTTVQFGLIFSEPTEIDLQDHPRRCHQQNGQRSQVCLSPMRLTFIIDQISVVSRTRRTCELLPAK